MTGLLLRAVLLLVAVSAVAQLLRLVLSTGRRRVGLPAGLVLVTGPDCNLCAPALRALQAAGANPTVVDVAEARETVGLVTSLPTALVVGDGGAVLARRAGRFVITDAETLAAASFVATAPLLQSPAPGRLAQRKSAGTGPTQPGAPAWCRAPCRLPAPIPPSSMLPKPCKQ